MVSRASQQKPFVVFRSHNPSHEKHDQQPPPPKLQPFTSLLDAQPPEVQGAFQSLLPTAMHKAGKFELLNLAGGFPAKHTLLVTAIPRCQKTTHPKKPAIKLPTMELLKLTKSLFSQRQQQDAEGAEIR